MTAITVSDIFITVNVMKEGEAMRDNAKGGALTEVTFYILLALYLPRHGYAVMQFIEEKTGGRLSLGAGTLYGGLNSLQEKGWIAPCGEGRERKKEFIITPLGREMAEKELARLKELTAIAADIIGGVHDGEEVLPVFCRSAGDAGQVAEQDGGQGLPAGAY